MNIEVIINEKKKQIVIFTMQTDVKLFNLLVFDI